MKFQFPDTGEGVTEGEFLEWLVEEGEQVEEDQVVAEAETDKAVVDIPAPADGTVKKLMVKPGDTVEVGDVIMEIGTEGTEEKQDSEEVEQEESETGTEEDSESTEDEDNTEPEKEKPVKKESQGQKKQNGSDVLALPKARKLAEEKGVRLSSLEVEGRITEEDVKAASGSQVETGKSKQDDTEQNEKDSVQTKQQVDTSGVNASPSVRRLAREKGVDISSMEGSGRGGEVLRADVLNHSDKDSGETGSEKSSEGGSREITGESERVEMSPVRRKTAEEMTESRFTAPHVTHVEKVDLEKLVQLREREKDQVDVHLTYLPFIMKAAQLAMEDYPELNAEVDDENNEIIYFGTYDFNIAVDTDRGLLVPVIREVDEKSIVELAEEVGDKAGMAKHGELSPEDMEKGTFSITNLGVIGGKEFTPIILPPQTAILGIGKIEETAEVVDGEVEPRHTVKLSLSYDHRAMDGATAARFMNELVSNLENPEKLMMRL